MPSLTTQPEPTNTTTSLLERVQAVLEQYKALQITVLDVRSKCSCIDYFVIANATSSTHMNSIADALVFTSKHDRHPPQSIENNSEKSWLAIDLNQIVVHIFRPDVRNYYCLEELWS